MKLEAEIKFSGKTSSYKGYIKSKKTYLKRKKQLNRELRIIKKRQRLCKAIGRRYYQMIIDKGNDDIYILRLMYNYHKIEYKLKHSKIKGVRRKSWNK